MSKQEWFASWFDSPFYPILYQHRDYREAENFISHLLTSLNPPYSAHFLDLACGRGRHSIFIHQKGYRVTGLDLSPESIADANLYAKDGLQFGVHDMREPLQGKFDYILNLFTSFGYFADTTENLKVLGNVKEALEPGGTFVLDFMNVGSVIPALVPYQEKELDGILFKLSKQVEDGFIVKDIHLTHDNQDHHFQERVQALDRNDFESMFAQVGLEVVDTWGNYNGDKYSRELSPRLIYFCR